MPIAMLHATCRLWANQAGKGYPGKEVSERIRKWVTFGHFKAAEAPAYDIALDTEGPTFFQHKCAATVMSDLENCIDNVKHKHLNNGPTVIHGHEPQADQPRYENGSR